MSLCRVAVLIAGAILLVNSPAHSQTHWARADSATTRLSPADFPELPAAVRRDLERRGCRIPQVFDTPEPHNVISGSFTARGASDWAVLCSIQHVSRILVYPGGAVARVDSIGLDPDIDFLQGTGGNRIGFSRAITVASAEHIRAQAETWDGPTPPDTLDHDGIDDAFVEKASVILYFHDGRWIVLQGAD